MHCVYAIVHIYYTNIKLANNVLTLVTVITHPDSDADHNDYQDSESYATDDETNYPP